MAASLIPLRDDDVDARGHVRLRVRCLARQRGDEHPAIVGACDDVRWRRAKRVGDQPGRMRERDLDLRARYRVQPAEHAVGGLGVVRQRRHAELDQGLVDEVPVAGRDQLVEVDGRTLGRDPGGHDHVDPVGPAVGADVHPVQDLVELGGVVEAHAAKHAESAGPADGGSDVL